MSLVVEKEIFNSIAGKLVWTAWEGAKKTVMATAAVAIAAVAVSAIQAASNPPHYHVSRKPNLITQDPEIFPGKTICERCSLGFAFFYYLNRNADLLLRPISYFVCNVLLRNARIGP